MKKFICYLHTTVSYGKCMGSCSSCKLLTTCEISFGFYFFGKCKNIFHTFLIFTTFELFLGFYSSSNSWPYECVGNFRSSKTHKILFTFFSASDNNAGLLIINFPNNVVIN